ncbi:phenylacetate--CoA ligase family protein [Bacillus sp. REN3]|uniref:phenylacetate--CoA ligase family protein n=1 Tax=Bacillus sp. REN3 TaxID=2802440 RepID=UPI001AEE765F|nr:phenylacetate--CoA ligase family protein [Bacillus sp. REN3]
MNSLKRLMYVMKLNAQGMTLKNLKQLEQIQSFPIERIRKIQNYKLEKLILHSYRNVPYYSKIFDEFGLVREGKVYLNRYKELPILEKSILKNSYDQLLSVDFNERKHFKNSSGGSTGEPVSFVQDKEYYEWMMAVKFLFNKWAGIEFGDSLLRLWGSERDLFVGQETVKTKVSRWLKNEDWINAFRMTNKDMNEFVEKINKMNPDHILAYVESVYELSKFIERSNKNVVSPDSIMTSAGTLFPHMRKTIERVFKTEVYNRYGSREVGDIASECNYHNGLHISSLTHYIEIVKQDGSIARDNEEGEIIITPLTNYSMPLLRYRIGDTGIISNRVCGCGINFPVLEKVTGRVTDRFIKSDGSVVVPEFLIHVVGVVLYDNWIKKFQVIQKAYSSVQVKIVPAEPMENIEIINKNQIDEIRKKIKVVMGEDCKVEFHFVSDIPPSNSGKYRYIISEVEVL